MTSSRVLLLFLLLSLVAGCGGGGGGGGSDFVPIPPSISNLRYSPTSAAVSNGTVTITATVDFVNVQGSVSTITLTTFDAAGQPLSTQTVPVQGVAGLTTGTISGTVQQSATTPGAFSFQVFVTNAFGLRSNVLAGTFTIYVPSPSPPPTGSNVLLVTVNGSLCSASTSVGYLNKPCVSATICTPGTTTCQTIDDILLDTGDGGLRIFKQALTVPLTQVMSASDNLAECIQYGDGSSVWGPVQKADVVLGTEPAVQVPVHVIDSSFGTAPTACSNAYHTPVDAGFNGILGVGPFKQDCGSTCANNAAWYYACNGPACHGVTAPLSDQVQNPVASLPLDNNGVIVKLSAVPSGGSPSADGYLVLGIGTQSNNAPPSQVTAFPANQYGDFSTTFSGSTYTAFIDTGSNGLFFPVAGTGITNCTGLHSDWLCPPATTNFSATTAGATGSPSGVVSFQIGNFDALVASSNNVFPDIGAPAYNAFDWGLPFHLGRDVYVGIEGKISGLGTGPYWGFWPY